MSTSYLRSFVESACLRACKEVAWGRGVRVVSSSCSPGILGPPSAGEGVLARAPTAPSSPSPCSTGVAGVPSELERWFRGIRELDDKAHALQLQLEADCNAQLRALLEESAPAAKKVRVAAATGAPEAPPTPGTDTSELSQRIEATTAELLRLSAEKVGA